MTPSQADLPALETPVVTRAALAQTLRRLGLCRGDWVMVHSSLSRFGYLEGGAEAVVTALCGCVTARGLLMMPTMTFGRWVFHRDRAPSGTGVITEWFRQRNDVVRSQHPTHSVAAWGHAAREIVAGHESASAFGADSPLARLLADGGKVLLLGVTHTSNSALHVAEARAHVAYYGRTCTAEVVGDDGRSAVVTLTDSPGCSRGFDRLEPLLLERKWIKIATLGAAAVRLMEGGKLLDACRDYLAASPDGLLCEYPDCAHCTGARRQLARHRPNALRQPLTSDS